MKEPFPFVDIPEDLRSLIGEPDPGTRMYRKYGQEHEMQEWFDTVVKLCEPGGTVSPGGAAGYARVTRAGLHKRLKEGRLTAFLFHVVKESFFVKGKMTFAEGRKPYACIPVSECKAWAADMVARREKEDISKEVNGDRDASGKVLESPPPRKWQRKKKA